jgi:hypothetical protein
MSNNSAAGAQPGPLPIIHRRDPVNNGIPRFEQTRPGLPDCIIYHSTVCPNLTGSSAEWLSTNPNSGVSIHTLANRDGSLTEICPPLSKAYHAGYCLPGWGNQHSLGIEIENASGNRAGDIEAYPERQINAAAYRVATWRYSFGIPAAREAAHKDVAVYPPDDPRAGQLGRKHDPVGPFPDGRFRALVEEWLLFFGSLPENEIPHYVQGAPEAPPAPPAPPDFDTVDTVFGPPTGTLAMFTALLLGSPALEDADAIDYWQASIDAGVNPFFMLAIFNHESHMGRDQGSTIMREKTKNPGALRPHAGEPSLSDGISPSYFRKYSSWLDGWKDMAGHLHRYYAGKKVSEVFPIWAPASDNNSPTGYIAAVLRDLQRWAGPGN